MSAMDVFWAAPPISRTLALGAFTESILVYTGFIAYYRVIWHYQFMLMFPPQVWRLATSFLLTAPKLGIIFDTYFLFSYGSKLERSTPKFTDTGDFFTYLVFVCLTILGLNQFITGGMVFSSALVLAMAYTATQDERGQSAQFIVITIPAQFIPYAMLLMTLILEGAGAAKVQATGLVAAHLHDFLTRLWPTFGGGRNLLPTPAFVKRWWQTTATTTTYRSYGTAVAPAQRAASASGASTGSVLPDSWKSRGSGHKLGGE